MFSHRNLSPFHFSEIMKNTMLNMVKEANKKFNIPMQNKKLNIENMSFLLELEDFQSCPHVGDLTPEALIYILDQFERRVSTPEKVLAILNRPVDESGFANETGFTPLGEAVLGSIIIGVKAFSEDTVWNEDFLQHLTDTSISQLHAVEYFHYNAVDHEVMPTNGAERTAIILSYVDQKHIQILEKAIPSGVTAHPLFFKHFSNQLLKREIKESVDISAKDTDSVVPKRSPTRIELMRSKVFEDTYESETMNSLPKVDAQYMLDMQNDVNYRYAKQLKMSKSPIFSRGKTVNQVTPDDAKADCYPCNLF